MSNNNIAILGGSFDPIHMGHLVIAQHVYDTKEFDEILIMPTGNPPHKANENMELAFDRLKMCELALKGVDYFSVSDLECYNDHTIYTIDTIKYLIKEVPEINYYMIIGADSLFNLKNWKDSDELLRICNFIVVNRPGFTREQILNQINLFKSEYNTDMKFIEIPNLEISSTYIREHVSKGQSIKYLVTDRVRDYIYGNGLYGADDLFDVDYFNRVKSKLKKKLVSSRYEHTLSVVNTAINLAELYGCNVRQAALAALLHDCAKNYSDNRKYELCEKYGIILSREEEKNIDLVHAKLGAMVAKHKYYIHDEEILSAIAYHTTGKSNMTLLEKIVYVADFIEPLRSKAKNLDEARRLSEISLDDALFNILECTVRYLEGKKSTIDYRTEEAFNFYKGQLYNE